MNTEGAAKGRAPPGTQDDSAKTSFGNILRKPGSIDELGRAKSAGSLEDTVRSARRKVVAACDHSMPRRGHGRTEDPMYCWNDQLSALRRECLTTRRRFTRSKGHSLLHVAWKIAKSALRQGIKKSRLQCWKNLIGEVEKDPWGLALKIFTKRLVTRRDAKFVSTCRVIPETGPKFLHGPSRRAFHSRRTEESRWEA